MNMISRVSRLFKRKPRAEQLPACPYWEVAYCRHNQYGTCVSKERLAKCTGKEQ